MKQPTTFQLSEAIRGRLQSVRGMLRGYVAAQGLLLVTLWLLVVFWIGGLIDYLPVTVGSNETPRWLRIVLLCTMAVGSGWIIARWIIARILVALHDASIALLIERHYPELNNELVTAVELSSKSEADISNPVAHQAMLERVHESVSRRIARVRPTELFNWQPLWATGIAAAFGLLLTAIAAVGLSDWTGRWARRLFALSDEPWPRKAALRADGIQLQIPAFSSQLAAERVMIPFDENAARVPSGAAARLQISADTRAQQVPEVCTLFYRSADGARGRANLRRVGSSRDGWQPFALDGPPLDGLSHDMVIDVVGLDARLRDLTIQIVEPAVIADMKLHCQYPGYLMDAFSTRPATETVEYRSGVTIPEGTVLTLTGTASSNLSRVDYLIHSTASDSESDGFEILSSIPDGKEFRVPLGGISASQVVEVRLIDEFDLSADQIPRYVLTMQVDTVPEVDSQLDGIGLAVTSNALLPLTGTVKDDHGIADVAVELAVNESQSVLVPVLMGGEELKSTIDLMKIKEQYPLQIEPGATLGMVVSARDNYDLGEQRHVGRGQPLQLSVVTADQLLVMLDRQELELRQRLELIVSELEQLREVLQTMKADLNPPASAMRTGTFSPAIPHAFATTAAHLAQADAQESRAEQVQRLSGLWAQQSILQADKSQQELSSVASRVENLRLQLINNRIDSYDRQERLLKKVYEPLRDLLASEYEALRRSLGELQTATLSGGGAEQSAKAAAALDLVLIELEAIKSNMQDIEDFNEIVDLVRDLLDDQERVLSETEQEQRRRILDLLR